MKNDTLFSDLDNAFEQVDFDADRLRVASWILHCMADPMESPPRKGMSVLDAMHFMADLLNSKADDLDKIAGDARDRLRVYKEQASR